MRRRICYVTGTRADFGLMERSLRLIHQHPGLELGLCVTGMHLSEQSGRTVSGVEASGLPLWGQIPVDLSAGDGAAMARALSEELKGLITEFLLHRPDMVLVLGDRGEMLAGALAAIHLNIPVVHVHGGERSGTVDEPVRHAISKLSHYHFTATEGARVRLERMGERKDRIFVTGAPGLDGLAENAPVAYRNTLCVEAGLDPSRPVALVIYHPVLQTAAAAGQEMATILAALETVAMQVLCFNPNADAGNQLIRAEIGRHVGRNGFRVITNIGRNDYFAWLGCADMLVGNSSSGIIEAASFGLPVVNIGNRQYERERNANTTDVPVEFGRIQAALSAALRHGRYPLQNVYGDGRAGERIVELLSTLPISQDLLNKSNVY